LELAVNARELIDASVESRIVQLDLGEDFKYLEIDIPRYSTWITSTKPGVALELLALNNLMKETRKTKTITEALSKSDKDQVERMIRDELKAYKKTDEKDDLTLAKNVLISFVKALYTKRGAWTSELSGSKSS
jgi:hypothetical protein